MLREPPATWTNLYHFPYGGAMTRKIQITRPIWRRHITEPKTRKSRGAIPVIAPLTRRLEFHRMRCGNPTSGVMFPNLNGTPMDLGNVLNRAILPTLNHCAICGRPKDYCGKPKKGQGRQAAPAHSYERDTSRPEWHGWHAARRGLGTNLYRLDVPEKRFRRFSATRMSPRPTRTTSRAQPMTPVQRWRNSKAS